jgi:CRP-like cAMP-binding protein
MDQKLTMLSKVPLFAGLSSRDLTEVGRLVDEIEVKAGKVLAKEGAPGHEFFVILDGSVAISKGDKHLRDLGPGDHFGELAMIARVPRTATATAATPATLLVLGHREFSTLLADRPEIREKVLREVAMWISQNSPTATH